MNMIRSFNPFVVRTQEPEDTRSKKMIACIPVVGRFIASRAQISLHEKAIKTKNYEINAVIIDYNRSSLLRNMCSIAFIIAMIGTQVLGTQGKIALSTLYLLDFYCEARFFVASYKRHMIWLDTLFPRTIPKSWYGAAGAE